MKRILACFLAMAMLLGSVPGNAIHVHASEAAEAEYALVQQHVVPGVELPDNDALYAAYAQQVLYGNSFALLGTAAGDRLTGDAKLLYDAVVPIIKQIAAGQRESAVIGVGSTVSYDGTTYTADVEATFSSASLADGTTQALMDALLSDLPYEMYWFDKADDHTFSIQTLSTSTRILHVQLCFTVADNYKGADDYTTDTAKTGAAAEAAANARTIVSANAGKSDYEKLLGYKTEICNLVSYDHAAADGGNFSEDNDPWQLIHVFDGDSGTNVVCEGYAKAFMYLCDLTDFSGDITCYTVTGIAGGPHMWNIVTIGGQNYLVDVTNSDSGTIGQDGSLFLAGAAGSAETGYTFGDLTYTYDAETLSQWGTDAGSILTLAETGYVPGQDTEEPVASGTCGENLTWVLTDDGTLTISGEGEMDDFDTVSQPWYNSRDSITSVVLESGITTIGDYAFYECASLASVMISDCVTTIGDYAFCFCESLTDMTIGTNVTAIGDYAFSQCDSLANVTIPEGVTTIGDYSFCSCALISITIPDGVLAIGNHAFYSCVALTSVMISDSVTTIGNSTFSNCDSLSNLTIGSSVTTIGSSAFSNCDSLTSVAIPDSVTAIGESAFYHCDNLTSVAIPDSVTAIGERAFYHCVNLTSVAIPDSVETIGNNAFNECDGLVSVTIGNSVTTIGDGAFAYCGNLTNATIGNSVTTIGSKVFYNCESLTSVEIPDSVISIGDYTFFCCESLTNIEIPNSVTAIGGRAFCGCSSLTSVTIPDCLTTLGDYVFSGCSSLPSVTIPNSVTVIGSNAFEACESLTSVTIPNSVTVIGSGAFSNCDNLASVTIPNSVTTIGNGAFSNCDSLTSVTIPDSVTVIDNHTFRDCNSLTSVTIPDSVTAIGVDAFSSCNSLTSVTIPDSVTIIGESAFSSCTGLTSVTIGNSVTTIDDYAFHDCDSLTSVMIPDSVTAIRDSAFEDCDGLTSVIIPDSVKTIGKYVFSDCSNIASVSIGNSVTNINNYAFFRCINLKNVIIPDSVTTIGVDAFSNCSSLTSVTIPNSVTIICNFAFSNCSSLIGVTIPDSVTAIGTRAFSDCDSLTSVTIGDNVTTINDSAFMNCDNLVGIYVSKDNPEYSSDDLGILFDKDKTKLIQAPCALSGQCIIPDGVMIIAASAFSNCHSLTDVEIPNSVMTIGGTAFQDCTSLRSITFHGNAPSNGRNMFYNVTATAYYPADDSTWTEDVMLSYGGTITWAPLCSTHHYESIVTAPTCTEGGYTTHTCTVCGDSFVDAHVDALGHTAGEAVVENNIAPTCESGGSYDSAVYCGRCGEELSRETVTVSATGHSFGTWQTTLDPTCTATGEKQRSCSACGKVEKETLPARDHSYEAVVTDPTCTEQGFTTHTCSTCGNSYVDSHVDALGHDMGEWVATEDPTCTEPGRKVRSCSRCDYQETDTIRPSGHSYSSTETAPTCTQDGYTTHVCEYCSDCYFDNYVSALGHDLGQWMPDGNGQERRECSRCDYHESREMEVIKPDAPIVKITSVASSGKPKLTWNKVEGARSYKVYRATGKDGEYTLLKSTTGTSLTNSSTEPGIQYYYYVVAVDEKGVESEKSGIVTCICALPRPVVTVTNVSSSGKPRLTWDKVEGAKSYRVYRATGKDGQYILLKTTTGTSLTNTSTDPGVQYYYKVVAVHSNSSANSAFSAVVTRTCDLPQPVVKITNVASSGKPKLTWDKVEGARSYKVYRSTSKDGEYILLKTTTGTSLTNTSTDPGVQYYYKVVAVHSNSSANSAFSAVVTRTCDLPRPVTEVTLNSKGKPVISWAKVSGAVKYTLYIYDADGKLLKTSTTTGTKITHNSAVSGTTYKYRVVAVHSNTAANSAKSSTISAKAK